MNSTAIMAVVLGVMFVGLSVPRLRKWMDMRKKKSTYQVREAKVTYIEGASRGRYRITYSFKSKNKKGRKITIKEKFYTRDNRKYEYADAVKIYVHPHNPYLCFVEEQVNDARLRFLGYLLSGIFIMVVLPIIAVNI